MYNLCLYIPLLERREVSILSTETEPQLQCWPLDEGEYIILMNEMINYYYFKNAITCGSVKLKAFYSVSQINRLLNDTMDLQSPGRCIFGSSLRGSGNSLKPEARPEVFKVISLSLGDADSYLGCDC